MKRWLPIPLALTLAVSVLGCAVRHIHDYIFDVTGVVTAEDGSPMKDAEITLEVNGPVYQAVTPVKTVKQITDGTGGFVFMYISHERGVKYTLTVSKDGFETETVSGSAPSPGHHAIRLKRNPVAGR